MSRVTIDHIERNDKIGRLSITGTVDDEQAACTMMESELEGLSDADRKNTMARRLRDSRYSRPPVLGKAYIEV